MSFDSRRHSKAYRLSWGHGRALLCITSESWVQDLHWRLNPVYFRLSVQDTGWINTGPVEHTHFRISPFLRRSWIDSLRDFLVPERTASWPSISACLRSNPHLPTEAYSMIMHRIWGEAYDAAQMAAFLGHCLMWITVDLMVTTDYTSGAIGEWEEIATDGEGEEDEDEDEDEDEEDQDEDQDDMEVMENRGLTLEEIEQHVMVARFSLPGPPEVCAICLEEVSRGLMAGWLPCSHIFHPYCITTWLSRKGACPLCRCVVPAN